MTFQITSIYTAALGVLALILSFHVIVYRAKTSISLMDANNPQMAERIRRHGNFCEYVPLALLLLAMAEASGASRTWLHVDGGLLLVSRIIHPFGIKHDYAAAPLRVAGASGTQLAMLIAIGLIAWHRIA